MSKYELKNMDLFRLFSDVGPPNPRDLSTLVTDIVQYNIIMMDLCTFNGVHPAVCDSCIKN